VTEHFLSFTDSPSIQQSAITLRNKKRGRGRGGGVRKSRGLFKDVS